MAHPRGGQELTTQVRRGGEGDRAYVLDLGRRVACDSVSSLRPGIPALVELAYEKLVDFVMGQSHAILIASNGERDLGFLLFLDSLPDEVSLSPQGFIAYMAVEPQARRHGVGSALLREAETVARERGLAFIAMMVTEENRAARELYDRFGFQTERRLLCKAV